MEPRSRSMFSDIVLGMLQVQRKSGKYCDVRLEVGRHHTWTHSAVMCALSPFINKQCCTAGKPPSTGDYKDFSLNSPLTIKLYRKNIFDCFKCLQGLVDVLYGQKIDHDAIHLSHLHALCKLLNLSEVLVKFICNQIPKMNCNEEMFTKNIKMESDCDEPDSLQSSDTEDCMSPRIKSVDIEKRSERRRKFLNIRTRFVLSDFKTLSGKKHACIECSYKCLKPSDLLKHLLDTGHGDQKCSLCLGKFESCEELKEHYLLHDNPKPFFCTFCDLRFQSRGLLSQHLPKHIKETPYTCSFCQKGFKWKHGLNSHMMIHSNEKKHLCDECGFSTMHAKTMRAHKLMHTGELFRCSFPGCTHTCSRKENMKIHLSTHNNDKPFVCEICGHKFTLNKSLKRHALIHTTVDLSNVCPHCPFRALRADNLKAHILRQHADKNVEMTDNFNEAMDQSDGKKSDEVALVAEVVSADQSDAKKGDELVILTDAVSADQSNVKKGDEMVILTDDQLIAFLKIEKVKVNLECTKVPDVNISASCSK